MDVVCILFVITVLVSTVTAQTTFVIDNIRLANGPNATSGRVEILVSGVWGTICDDQWDNLDASVACRMLGFTGGGFARTQATFGPGSGDQSTILMDDTQCDGGEARLDICRFTPAPIQCSHNEDAGVVCIDSAANPGAATTTTTQPPVVAPVPDNCNPANPATDVRLVATGGVRGMGIVEVRNPNTGVWGSVCDDFFDINAAKVVCRSLCFDPNLALPGAPANVSGTPREDIILDDVRCGGNENAIQDCVHANWGVHNCGPLEVAKVTCRDFNYIPPPAPSPLLECREGYLIAAFSKARDPYLEEKHLTIATPFSGVCDLRKQHDNNTVVIRIPFDACGTEVSFNATHLIYKNVIKYDMTRLDGVISRVNTYRVEVYCEMPRNAIVTRPIEPITEIVTQKATGQFVVTMSFFKNNSFGDPVTETPLRLPIGEWLNIALQLESVDSRLKLVVPDCVATPDEDMANSINYPLFTNSCREEPTLTFFNLNQTRFGYRYQPFMFVNFQQVFLHCGAFVCLLNDESAQCDRSCNSSKPQPTTSGRRKREAPLEKIYVHSGPLIVYKLDNSMTVLERVGDLKTYSTTFTLPMTTTTPTPTTSHRVGTSVRVHPEVTSTEHTDVTSTKHPEVTSTRTDDVSGSGDGDLIFLSSTQWPTTKKVLSTKTLETTTKTPVTTTLKMTSSKQDDEKVSTVRSETTKHIPTTTKTTTSDKKTTQGIEVAATSPQSTTVLDNGFYLERGSNSEFPNPSPAKSSKAHVLQGYIPDFTSSSQTNLPYSYVMFILFLTVSCVFT